MKTIGVKEEQPSGTDPSDAVLAELHRRRLNRDVLTSAELSERVGIDPDEEAMWRKRALREIRR